MKVSFFGDIDTGRVGDPERTDDGVLRVASLLDLFGTKLKVLLQRVAARDYLDLAAILRAGAPLEDGLGAATTLYGQQFPPTEAVKASRISMKEMQPTSMPRHRYFFRGKPRLGTSR